MIVDMHAHAFPDSIAEKALRKMRAGCHTKSFTNGTYGQLESSSREAGIDWTVVLPVATSERQVAHINDSAMRVSERAAKEHTGILSFGAAHPLDPNWQEELDRVAETGLRGIKIHPPYQGVDIDDTQFLRLLYRAGELGLIVVTHAGLDVGLPGNECSTVEKIARAVRQVGPVKLICAHMGGWRCWEDVCEMLVSTSVMIDTSFSLGTMVPNDLEKDDYPWTEEELKLLSPEAFCRMVRLFTADRVLFGTDSPWADRKAAVERIQSLPLTAEEKEKILGTNAERLLGIR